MWSASLPHCSSQFIYARMWGRGVCYRLHCLSRSSHNPPVSGCSRIATSPVCPSCLSPPLLPVWMNVSFFFFLSPCLLDFHAVRFSVSSGYFLFLYLWLSFWLGEEAQCVYLCLHLGWKFPKRGNFNLDEIQFIFLFLF